MKPRIALLPLFLGAFLPLHAEEPDYSAELPSIPAKEPAEALASFTVKPPFEMQLAAAEPTVMDPVAMAFVAPDAAEPGSQLYVDVRGTRVAASVTPLPFYKRGA